MAYTAPYIDAAGYHYPTYDDILSDLVDNAKAIYGTDIYLGSDSQDYQILSIVALKIYDCFQAVELAYNAHSPATAIGTALDYIVAINGITRNTGTKSKAQVKLEGAVGTRVLNGIVSDLNGVLWDLPEEVTISTDGSVTVEATCRQTGVVSAPIGTITRIMTPTLGWLSVTNETAAVVGTVTESDSELRMRQLLAVAQASQSILQGLKGALLALNGVTRVEILENDTGSTDDRGLPAHSICCIVEGGDANDIARAILNHKSAGCQTWADSSAQGYHSVTITDTTEQTYIIKYAEPAAVDIAVNIAITRLAGYSDAIEEKIKTAIISYASSYQIGRDFVTSMLWSVTQSVNDDPSNPSFYVTSLTAKKSTDASYSADNIELAYNEYARSNANAITITVT